MQTMIAPGAFHSALLRGAYLGLAQFAGRRGRLPIGVGPQAGLGLAQLRLQYLGAGGAGESGGQRAGHAAIVPMRAGKPWPTGRFRALSTGEWLPQAKKVILHGTFQRGAR